MMLALHSIINRTRPIGEKLQPFLYHWRGLFIILAIIYVSVFEIIEHPNFLTDNKHDFFKEIGVYYSLIFIAAIMFELALRAGRIKNQTISIVNARHNLSLQLSSAKDWDEVVTRVLQYPSSVLKVSATTLLMYKHFSDDYITERSWVKPNEEINIQSNVISRLSCCAYDIQLIAPNVHLVNCERISIKSDGKHVCYHLILNYGSIPVGILNITLPKNKQISDTHAQLFSKTAEDIAIGLSAAKHRQVQHANEVANAASKERLEIARDLHDTLGQNLGYLHLKLDQILTDSDGISCQAKTTELERLRDVANESYELVRNTLVILHHMSDRRISELFNAHTQIIAKRAGLSISIVEEGLPRSIPPDALKQLLFAFKESLYNIERHSGAKNVKVVLSWTDVQLLVRIVDDGNGFEVADEQEDGHYGLHIIYERIHSLGGKVEINSRPGQGTEVMFWLPVSTPVKDYSELLIGES
jgi:signal transduction histidine kinase